MIIYVVKKGDTFTSIANLYNTTPEFIATQNGFSINDTLVIGQSLVIPQYTEKLGKIATNGYLYTNIDEDILKNTLPYLTFATIFTYGFKENGDLVYADDEKVLEIIKSYNVKPIMLISTLTEEGKFSNELSNKILNDINSQNVLIDNILKNIKEKGYFGLDIDFEYIFPEDKDSYVAFIDNITTKLNKEGYPVIVSLAPKTSSTQPGLLYEAHDYKSIGNIANAVLLMTYEWGYTYGPPMAVAPINKVKDVLDYAITVIPNNKIFMGIPNYGYDWTLPYEKGISKAKSIGNVEAINIAREKGSEILFDETSQAPYFYYYDEDNKEHIVWFEDARSIYTKVTTAFKYGFPGISYWNIMRYFPQNWLVVSQLFDIYKIM
ncbi:glycosyl hydrolase family 18 protein [uncultured Tyzzerella sp.]|uniref:glycosyl hydrolase family 18 protein n=1 Tax=uncultured Tyzzerella sp. TaxID=2321398 RepID=UPI002943E1D7|nr:glycosyl hydrolase family 18 protein [uncultured Tyzzerella sp.]